jgi:hypothetical protein
MRGGRRVDLIPSGERVTGDFVFHATVSGVMSPEPVTPRLERRCRAPARRRAAGRGRGSAVRRPEAVILDFYAVA